MANIVIKKPINTELNNELDEINSFILKYKSWSEYVMQSLEKFRGTPAVLDEANGLSFTYDDVIEKLNRFSTALASQGIQKGDFVSLFSENNGLHFICHQGIMQTGACSVLRGVSSPAEELDYILKHSDSKALVISDFKSLTALTDYINQNDKLMFVVVLFDKKGSKPENINKPVYMFEEFLNLGSNYDFQRPEMTPEDNALMIYTSGTTGFPKGVMLIHKNVLSQMIPVKTGLDIRAGEKTLQILPVWHSYEMLTQSLFFTSGLYLHFTTLPKLKEDLKKYQVDIFMTVPRIWEALRLGVYQRIKKKSKLKYKIFDFAVKMSIKYKIHKMYSEQRITNKRNRYHLRSNLYHRFVRFFIKPLHLYCMEHVYEKIKAKAGLNFRVSLSGGSALSLKDELFYDALGINLRVGYGLTETSPILTLRHANDKNYLCSVGKPVMGTEIKIVDINGGYELGAFQKGVVLARGPQVMKGYYKDDEATKKVVDKYGWFNTGDLGWLTYDNHLVLVGRSKETIVLSNGENVEPVPIEEACLQSSYIEQIVLVGQDEPNMCALVVPTREALEKCELALKEMNKGANLTIKNPNLKELIKKEIDNYIKSKPNLKSFEKIKSFEILEDNFNQENGLLSQTGKLKRGKIIDRYKDIINNMFSDNKKDK